MAETTNLPPGGYVVDYSQPNPEANEWEAYQYGYMPNAEKFKQYRVERYDPEFGAYVTDIYNADTGQFYATAKGTENKFLDKVVQPIAMAGLTAAIGSAGANLLGLGGAGTGAAGASSAAAGDIAFAAADAAQLAAQGLGEAQIAQTLATTGLDAFVATDMAQLAAQGLNASQIASTVGATAAGTGGGLFNTLSPAQAVAQGVAEFPNAAGASNAFAAGPATPAATAAAPAATTPAATQAATSGASGLLSGLTPAQISSLLQAGVGLLSAGAAGSALGGGGGTQAISPTSLPQQAPAAYDQGYFDTLNRYYSTYLPGQQADTAMLQSWYNRQPMQTGGAMSSGMGGGLSPAAIQGQQVLGQQSNFNTLFNTLFGSVMGQPLNTTGPEPVTASTAARPTSDSPFVAGPGSQEFGGFRTQEQYNQAVAENRAAQQEYLDRLINYTPSAPFLASYFANPETIPLQAGESIDRAILRLKSQDMQWAARENPDLLKPLTSSNVPVSSVGLSWLPTNWTNEATAPAVSNSLRDIQNWYAQNQGGSQENLDRFLATSGYTPERVQNIIEGVQSTAGSASKIQNPFPSAPAPTSSPFVIGGSVSNSQNLQGLFQEVYGRAGTPEEIANVQGMGLGDARNILETSLANWNAMQNR